MRPDLPDLDREPYLDFEPPLERPGDPIEEAALKFHLENPHILREIVAVCLLVRRRGRLHWSIKAAFEVVRYNAEISTSGRTYKINNNHARLYSRWIMRDFPELDGFFTTREQGRVEQHYDE